jgi:hypothetical protein
MDEGKVMYVLSCSATIALCCVTPVYVQNSIQHCLPAKAHDVDERRSYLRYPVLKLQTGLSLQYDFLIVRFTFF